MQAGIRHLLLVIALGLLASISLAAPASSAEGLTVLIDPGHGGSNTGAASVRDGIFEKHITAALANALRKELEARKVVVHLTRTHDEYLTLRQRGRMANELDVDLFVSLHGNATEAHSQRGFETFILTTEAVDVDSRILRRDSGRRRPGLTREVSMLLDDVERGASQERSYAVAKAIQRELRALRGADGDRGVRQGSMDVLMGTTMPAVLVEVGFIDHPSEGEEMVDPATLTAIAQRLAMAIESQAAELKKR